MVVTTVQMAVPVTQNKKSGLFARFSFRRECFMEELTSTHLRYLLAIYQIAKLERDVCSTSISQFLNVSGPSVS